METTERIKLDFNEDGPNICAHCGEPYENGPDVRLDIRAVEHGSHWHAITEWHGQSHGGVGMTEEDAVRDLVARVFPDSLISGKVAQSPEPSERLRNG